MISTEGFTFCVYFLKIIGVSPIFPNKKVFTKVIVYDNLRRGGTVMSNASVSFDTIKNELMQEDEFRSEYEKLQPRYEIISQIIEARKARNMTQAELAKLVGTQKSNISRLEGGNYNPSLDFLIKVAVSLGKELKIQLQ